MKTNTLFILLIIFTTLNLKSQQIQTYNGAFEDGIANYQYYENESYERIFNGNFTFKSKGCDIVGQFKNNKRNGIWKVIVTNGVCYNCGDMGKTFNSITIANYIDGNLDGHCSFEKMDTKTKKLLFESSANFKNNVMIGKFFYKSLNFSLDAKLNKYGFLDSTLRLMVIRNGIKFENIRKYRDGYMFFELSRNLATGEILSKTDLSKFYDLYFKNLDTTNDLSIIPYFEFQSKKDIPSSVMNVTQTKNETAFYIANVPIVGAESTLDAEYNSEWNTAFIIDFWTATNISHAVGGNPLNYIEKGMNPTSSITVKIPKVNEKMFDKLQKDFALNTLKNAIDSSIVWIKIEGGKYKSDSINTYDFESFYISSLPITETQKSGYFLYNNMKTHDYSLYPIYECASQIRSKRTERVFINSIGLDFSNEPDTYLSPDKVKDLLNILKYRKAALSEIEYAKTKGLVVPKLKKENWDLNYFVKTNE